ncbi:helix-turn-helix transcriptional regulator [bacterium]|nr:helix-turn-helix transcriptional regulator [bacterium]
MADKSAQKKILLKTIGKYVKEHRLKSKKGILLLSYEFDISNSSISKLEAGERDVQISTLWKIANAFGMDFSDFIREIEERLPENFKLIDN